jgi:hypothetical protein
VSAEEGDDSGIEVAMKSYTVNSRWIDADFGRLLCKGLITWCHENKVAGVGHNVLFGRRGQFAPNQRCIPFIGNILVCAASPELNRHTHVVQIAWSERQRHGGRCYYDRFNAGIVRPINLRRMPTSKL